MFPDLFHGLELSVSCRETNNSLLETDSFTPRNCWFHPLKLEMRNKDEKGSCGRKIFLPFINRKKSAGEAAVR